MSDCSVFVGLDYHQDAVQVCVLRANGEVLANGRCPNQATAVAAFVGRHGVVAGAAVESCVGAANLAEELVVQRGWSVDLAHPGYIARMKQNPDKSDFSDARLLADLERVGYLPKVWMAPEEVRELRRMVRYRFQQAEQRKNLKLRIRATLRDQRVRCTAHRPWTQGWLEWLKNNEELSEQSRWVIHQQLCELRFLEETIASAERRLARLTENDPLVAALLKEPGIGPVTAWVLRAEIGRFDRFRTGKQLSRFCGLSPRNASSGNRQADAGLIRAGNRNLRMVLIEAGHRLRRYQPRWQTFGERLARQGKPGSVIVAAVANRWVRGLFYRMRPVGRNMEKSRVTPPTAA
jgi:transposase